MSSSENKKLLQHIFGELALGNSRPLVENMAEDFQWTVAGKSRWSGTFRGRDAVLNQLMAPLRAQIEGRIKTVPLRFIAEDDFVVVEARGNNMTRSGTPYNNSYCFVVRVDGGKLQEITEYMDTELVSSVLKDPAA